MKFKFVAFVLLVVLGINVPALQYANGIDPEAIIEQVIAVNDQKKDGIKDIIFEVESLEGEMKDDGFKEKERFDKKIYIKFSDDTTYYFEEYLAYYKDGEQKSEKDLKNKAKEKKEKQKKRKARNISFPVLRPFYPDYRQDYEIIYNGLADDEIDGYTCHHFRVNSNVEDDDHINGDFYIEANTFNLVRVDFTPAKLKKNMMFKLKDLKMSIMYAEHESGYWLPIRFDLTGKGKAAFFFGVNFAAKEYFENPQINTGIDMSVFEEKKDD